ncbi:TPA: type II secretion system protein [Candidatus Spyradomonas excrementavium]|nr:type II secretion system protein [Candidatus Spyradomonas excrementavium]
MKKAFTLAEALIALMIIGVIAALLLRTLNRVTPDKEKVMYIKAYHTLEQVVADTINDPSKYDQEIGATSAADFSQAPLDLWGTSISGASGCNSVGQSNALCCFMADKVNIIGTGNCSANDNFTTTNGIKWSGVNGGSYPKTITVDVNGDEDGGTYSIIVNSDGKVYPPTGGKEEEFLQEQTKIR